MIGTITADITTTTTITPITGTTIITAGITDIGTTNPTIPRIMTTDTALVFLCPSTEITTTAITTTIDERTGRGGAAGAARRRFGCSRPEGDLLSAGGDAVANQAR